MTNPLVECIPNYSEARRPEVIEAIIQSISAVPGVHVLDRHSDMDHNRTVITFVGAPAAVEEAAFQSIACAAQNIDLDHHQGEHPRIGATDVVPFVPISDISMVECVEMARRLGKRVGDELHIPVYLYEEAATRPERQNLENIRRGQYEALKVEMGVNPERDPDFGPARVTPAGATVIGARHPLVAFNAYLTTDQVSIAQKIAKAVRNSSGGLHYVKALGLLVEGRAQVSMNLTNFRQTPVARVVEMIRREAQRYGVGIHHTELVGLIPQEALVNASQWYLQLDEFHPEQILENRLFGVMTESQTAAAPAPESSFLDDLAAGTAAPGGGSASAHTGAAAAALVAMVSRLTIGKKKYAAVEPEMWTLLEKAEGLRSDLTKAVEEDAAAFDLVMAAMKLPKDTEVEQHTRTEEIEKATLKAAQVPLHTAQKSLEVQTLAVRAATIGNLNAISDAAAGATLAKAALTGAGLNVRINTVSLQDRHAAETLLDEINQIENRSRELETELQHTLTGRGGFPL
ncbi:MAG: glutamate formimidoyltransferase [Anaerolineaceae bacterium]